MNNATYTFCSVDWDELVRILSALLTPTIACITTYIALQQYKNNRNQFRLAIFDRRSKIFSSTSDLIATVLRLGRVISDDLSKFLYESAECEFLFGSDITNYVHELYSRASDIYSLEGATDERPREQRKEAILWFSGQGEKAKEKFRKYMRFEE